MIDARVLQHRHVLEKATAQTDGSFQTIWVTMCHGLDSPVQLKRELATPKLTAAIPIVVILYGPPL